MQTAEWALGLTSQAGYMYAVCEKDEKSIRISMSTNKDTAQHGLMRPQALGLFSSEQPLARKLSTSNEDNEQDAEYAVSMAGKLAKRCRKPVHIFYDSHGIPIGDLCDEAFLLALKMSIKHFNL